MHLWRWIEKHALVGGFLLSLLVHLLLAPAIFFGHSQSPVFEGDSQGYPIYIDLVMTWPGFLGIVPKDRAADDACLPAYRAHTNERTVRDCTERGLSPVIGPGKPVDFGQGPEWSACYGERRSYYRDLNIQEFSQCYNSRFFRNDYRFEVVAMNFLAYWLIASVWLFARRLYQKRRGVLG